MILVNLLPHREERRKRRKAAYFAGIGLSAAAGLLIAGLWYAVLQQMTSLQQERNSFLLSETRKLEAQIKDVATLKSEIESLKARQKAVEDLQVDRNVPVHVLNELVKQTPEGIYFTSVRQDGNTLTVAGVAQTNERVSEFLRNTNNDSDWLSNPQLVEIKISGARAQDHKRLFEFSTRLNIKRPQDRAAQEAAEAAKPGAAAAASVANKG